MVEWRWGLCLLLSCMCSGAAPAHGVQRVVLRLQGPQPVRASALRLQPAAAVRRLATYGDGTVVLERRVGTALRVEAPGHCAVTLAADASGQSVQVPLRLQFPRDPGPLGFGAEASFEVQPGCGERPLIRWQQVEGPKLQRLDVLERGYRIHVQMPAIPELAPTALGKGIVPISPRTQGRVVLTARTDAGDVHRLQLVATSRATGLPSVAVSQQLLLAGEGWHVEHAAVGGKANVEAHAGLQRFTPDAPGRWQLRDAQGAQLTISAFAHDETPLDCGRAECHAAIAEAAEHTPMSHALERSLEQHSFAAVGCMLDCHVSGERGLRDGGFLDVQQQLGFRGTERARWADLPQPLRRLGGVRCTSCHGPGAIPQAPERALILRSDVCATCHDAPPAYPQAVALARTRMAHADGDPRAREAPCARCHTTQGFLERVAQRKPLPPGTPGVTAGIGCAACHAPHARDHGTHLLRRVPMGGSELSDSDALCSGCHAPSASASASASEGQGAPYASSAALWLGELQLPAAGAGAPEIVRGPAPHRDVPGGCTGCHGRDASGRVDHTFDASRARCQPCHAREPDVDAALTTRARALVAELEWACGAPQRLRPQEPPHATPTSVCSTASLTRARYLARTVLEDRAAAIHNAPFARELLDRAQREFADHATLRGR